MSNTVFEAVERAMKIIEPAIKMQKMMAGNSAMEALAMKAAAPLPNTVLQAIEIADRMSKFQLPTLPRSIMQALEMANHTKKLIAPPLPDHLVKLIESICVQQERYANLFVGMDKMRVTAIALSQRHSLQNAFALKTDQIFSKLALAGQWPEIEAFEEISDNALDLGERLAGQSPVTREDFERFQAQIVEQISRIGKDVRSQAGHWMAILGVLYMFLSEYRYQTQQQAVTMEQLTTYGAQLIDSIKTTIREQKEYRLVDRPCRVYVKPKFKSYVITQLNNSQEIIILQSEHKWVQISFTDKQDGRTETGWIQKKYIRPRFR
jgi:hypothetical protein